MSPKSREWLTEGEIRSLVDEQVGGKLDHLANGAQASMNTAALLFGDERWKIKGFVEETREQLAALKEEAAADRELANKRHDDNTTRLAGLEAGQHKIRRCIKWAAEKSSVVGAEWKLFVAACSAFGIGVSIPNTINLVKRIAAHFAGRHTH